MGKLYLFTAGAGNKRVDVLDTAGRRQSAVRGRQHGAGGLRHVARPTCWQHRRWSSSTVHSPIAAVEFVAVRSGLGQLQRAERRSRRLLCLRLTGKRLGPHRCTLTRYDSKCYSRVTKAGDGGAVVPGRSTGKRAKNNLTENFCE